MVQISSKRIGYMDPVKLYSTEDLVNTLKQENVLIVQVTDFASYAKGHIPDAVLVTPEEIMNDEMSAVGKLPSFSKINDLLTTIGYQQDDLIIAYDNEGGGWAGRFLWLMDCICHQKLGYLNGGLPAWVSERRPLETRPPTRKEERSEIRLSIDAIAEIEDVMDAIESSSSIIWDARSHGEFNGTDRRAARGGHIPSAIHLDWLELRDPFNFFRLPKDLSALLKASDLLSGKNIITYCQSHHRSGLSYLVGRLYGMNIKAYAGGWAEWGNRVDTPIAI
mgnify:FL=1